MCLILITAEFRYVKPVEISTAMRNLQSQMIISDLPRAAQTLGERVEKFRAPLLNGRANYLCLRIRRVAFKIQPPIYTPGVSPHGV